MAWPRPARGRNCSDRKLLARLQANELDQTVQELGAREKLARIQLDRTQALLTKLDGIAAKTKLAEAYYRVKNAKSKDDLHLTDFEPDRKSVV